VPFWAVALGVPGVGFLEISKACNNCKLEFSAYDAGTVQQLEIS